MEILSPAGSLSSLKAAVYNGADAVYLGLSDFNARMSAENFTQDNIFGAIRFCHERGVAVHAVINTLIAEREFDKALDTARILTEAGTDAFIVQDLGFASELMKRTDAPVHASTQLSVHTLDGVRFLSDLGFSRAVLSREVSRKEIEHIVAGSPIEIEVFCHGAMCMAYSGQCYMSAIVGGRSGNRGRCAQPCRLPYSGGYELSLKDMSLLRYVKELENIGVSCLKIEGRMKGGDYVGAVTRAYADAKRGKPFDSAEEDFLAGIFSRSGFSDGYYTGNTGRNMFGVRSENSERYIVREKEYKRFDLTFTLKKADGNRLLITGETSDGYAAEAYCEYEAARKSATTSADAEKCLSKLGDTVYNFNGISSDIPENIFIPVSSLNRARREITENLCGMRVLSQHGFRNFKSEAPEPLLLKKSTRIEAFFLRCSQAFTAGLDFIWLPVTEAGGKAYEKLLKKMPEGVGVWLPSFFSDFESAAIKEKLKKAREQGVGRVLVNNVGHIFMCRNLGFEVCGNSGLNVFNPYTVRVLRESGLAEQTLSIELNRAQINDIAGADTGLTVYGRLPLMTVKNCIKNTHIKCRRDGASEPYILRDRTGRDFYVTCEYGCRNIIWNGDVLYLADKDLPRSAFHRFIFTDEGQNTSDIADSEAVISDYYDGADKKIPAKFTRGLFYRKV